MNPLVPYPRTADLAHWINEREAIRLRREAGVSPPWTADPTMATVRYCNVHREDDKITRWIRSHPVYSSPTVPVWVVVLARMVNRISSLEAIEAAVYLGDLTAVKSILKSRRDYGFTIWGNAYTISTCGRSMDKVDYVIDMVVDNVRRAEQDPLWSQGLWHDPWTLSNFHQWLMRIDGLGSFLAAQVVADLKNTDDHPLLTAPDWWTWAACGPGSLKGLAAYHGTLATPGNFTALLGLATAQVTPLIGAHVGAIHAQDMQNCFCEFSKYIRVREGGHARNRYDARNPS